MVIPVFCSQATLFELHERLVASLEKLDLNFEIIFVEDCGGDSSWDVICEIAKSDCRVKGLQLSRNFGQHAATICGFVYSRGDWVATLDDDLEQSPESLPDLYKAALEGRDLVYGVYTDRSHQAWRNVTSSMARWLFNRAIPSLNYDYTSFRVIRGSLARELREFDSPFPFVDGYLSWLTNSCGTVVVPHTSRASGNSNYSLRKLIIHALNIFVTFSDLPLRMASWFGMFTFILGMCWLSLLGMRYWLGGINVSGFTSIMVAILLFSGAQLMMLGIFGQYLGRMNFKLSNKPLFFVGRSTSGSMEKDGG